MREKLNESPVAQAALIGVLLLATAFMLMGGIGGGSKEEAPAESSTAPTSPTPGTTTVTGSTAPAPAVDPATGAPVATDPAAALPASGIPEVVDPLPLPRPLVSAYKSGRIVVLLIVRGGAIDDRIVARSVRALEADGSVSAFVVPVEKISRYTAVTQGVGVNRTPALVVLHPKAASPSGPPAASVSYGFQSPQTVVQAVRDAAYQGPEATYNPD